MYKAYLSSGGETQVVAVKAGKGAHCCSVIIDERSSIYVVALTRTACCPIPNEHYFLALLNINCELNF